VHSVSPTVNSRGMIWEQVNLKSVSKAGNPLMKQSKNTVLMLEILYAMFWQVMIMLMAIFGHAVLGLCERARRTACFRTAEGGKLNEVSPQDEHQTMHAIGLWKHVVVLSKSDGPQKWLAPRSADVHRGAPAIDVCTLEKDCHVTGLTSF
jgi:hypothetical protein